MDDTLGLWRLALREVTALINWYAVVIERVGEAKYAYLFTLTLVKRWSNQTWDTRHP